MVVDDLKNFGVKHGVDFIAASFVRKASDIEFIRQVLGNEGANIKVEFNYLLLVNIHHYYRRLLPRLRIRREWRTLMRFSVRRMESWWPEVTSAWRSPLKRYLFVK